MTKFYTQFHEMRFRASVSKALKQVQAILDTTRNPRLPEDDEEHTYDDKFALAEFLTNTAIAAQMNALEALGLKSEQLSTVVDWVHQEKKSVTLRFEAHDSCSFLKEQDVERGGGAEMETTTTTSSSGNGPSAASSSSFFGPTQKTETVKSRVITKVKEYHWQVEAGYKIVLYPGSDPACEEAVQLDARTSSTVIVTSGGQANPNQRGNSQQKQPIASNTTHTPVEANMTWFFQMITKDQVCQFSIDRSASATKTPRRNNEISKAFDFSKQVSDWCKKVENFFLNRIEKEILQKHKPVKRTAPDVVEGSTAIEPGSRAVIVGLQKEPTFNGKAVVVCEYLKDQQRYRVEPVDKQGSLPPTLLIKPSNIQMDHRRAGPALSGISAKPLFCPIVPLFENGSVLPDINALLAEQSRSMDAAIDGISKIFPPRQLLKLVSVTEATLVLLCQHYMDLIAAYQDGIDYIEHLLKTQLVQAIGKEVQPKDFAQFMRFYNARLFLPAYAPKPFTYAVRRPQHDPEGLVTIEAEPGEPIETMVRQLTFSCEEEEEQPSILMSISAATTLELRGSVYLHGWIQHRFGDQQPQHTLVARARQFSSFLLVIGNMASANRLDPKHAIIIQNKDELLIPLLADPLPSAKDFKDAIASLSPEQREFCKAFRNMQLSSSVFCVGVIQLKPQLETLLKLPAGSLTKEIQLTQDLLSLFVDYQIPSDLLSFDGAENASIADKVATVKAHVKSVLDVITAEKEKQLTEQERRADMHAETLEERRPIPTQEMWASAVQRKGRKMAGGGPVVLARQGMALGGSVRHSSRDSHLCSLHSASEDSHPAANEPFIRADGKKVPRVVEKSAADADDELQSGHQEELPVGEEASRDVTLLPKLLDRKIESLDDDNSLRSTVIKPESTWTRKRQDNLLTPMKTTTLNSSEINDERKQAFDLLDALSRSGALPIENTELHVVLGVSHCFDNDVMGTILRDNVNPIEKVERSSLLVASVIYGQESCANMIQHQSA